MSWVVNFIPKLNIISPCNIRSLSQIIKSTYEIRRKAGSSFKLRQPLGTKETNQNVQNNHQSSLIINESWHESYIESFILQRLPFTKLP